MIDLTSPLTPPAASRHRRLVGVFLVWPLAQFAGCTSAPSAPMVETVPANAPFDYQIGGDYEPPSGATVVSRDWFVGEPLDDGYSICYVNAFQTQGDEDLSRPDARSNWPNDLVLTDLGDDPNWGGEYLVDISTTRSRDRAADWLRPMITACADKGFDAVEFDNLDSWTRFDDTPLEFDVPFERADAEEFARTLTDIAHDHGLASAQKNTSDLASRAAAIGFDLAVVEECGRFDECGDFAAVYGADIVAIEYGDRGFATACRTIGDVSSVVRRDVDVTRPGSAAYVHDEC